MELNYTVKGKNQSLILLHGWGGSSSSLDGLQEGLAQKGFLVFNLDLPGFGKTPLTKSEMNIDDYANAIVEFIKSKNIYKPVLIGHSFGGKLAIKLALEQPDLISKIVLIGASGVKPLNDKKKSIFLKVSSFGKKIFTSNLLKSLYNPVRKFYYYFVVRERDYFNAGEKLQKTFIKVSDVYFDHLLNNVSVPTLVVWGSEDMVTPLWMGEKLKSGIPGAKLKVVGDARHNLPTIKSEIVSEIIYNYLNEFN